MNETVLDYLFRLALICMGCVFFYCVYTWSCFDRQQKRLTGLQIEIAQEIKKEND